MSKRSFSLPTKAAGAALIGLTLAFSVPAQAFPGGGGDGPRAMRTDRNLTSEQARDIVAGGLAMRGVKTLTVGSSTMKDEDTIAITLVTDKGEVVKTLELNKDTGRPETAPGILVPLHDMRGKPGKDGGGFRERMKERFGDRAERAAKDPEKMQERRAQMMERLKPAWSLDLTEKQAATLLEARMIRTGETDIQLAKVEPGPDATQYRANLLSPKGSYIGHFLIDRSTGRAILNLE